jgi:hypothetical protein
MITMIVALSVSPSAAETTLATSRMMTNGFAKNRVS